MKIKLQTMKLRYEPGKDENQLIEILDNCNEELYKIIDDLHSPEFEERDLSVVLAERIEMVSKATDISIIYEPIQLNIKVQTAIKVYRVICELLTNSIKHSGCSEISLVFEKTNNLLCINYADNGIGMQNATNPNGRGVQNIKSRIAFLEGSLDVISRSGETRYTINIPINNKDEGPINIHL
jgi:signal transduction histidine kinase